MILFKIKLIKVLI